ncbi:MAG: type I polyketide synthase, partial [bacterium]|nr:type I polyketide synthase [bacterium]
MKKSSNKASQTGLEIAVIGMSGRFPGANDIHTFWENLKNGVESITFFSDEELLEAGITPDTLKKPNYVKAKGYIEDLQYFDSSFFKYTPGEAALMDPQLRLFHECTWHALEDAGYDPRTYNGLIGLYAGYTPNTLWKLGHLYQSGRIGSEIMEIENLNSLHFTSLISYKLNLKGPAVSVNTACSTSLVAVHMACRALLTGEADIILAGGVTVTVPSRSGYSYEEGMIMSPDGRCRSFDAKADGTASGNGAAVVVLKRLVKAIKDGDHVYAVIKGTAINNDGNRKAGYTALSVEAQAQVIRAAQRMAEVEPESITYIETHGIGIPLGDPIEIEALKKAFSKTGKKQFCRIGALKPNIGHLDAAAGAAGLIKTALALQHRCIPPAVNFDSPNPEIDFENSPFYVDKTPEEWHSDEYPLRAGVSCFGIGGTNAHVVLEEWPDNAGRRGEVSSPLRNYQLIVLSAKTQTALDKMTENLGNHFKENPDSNFADAAYTLQVGRQAFNYRRMLVCRDRNEAGDSLLSPGSGSVCTGITELEDRPVVLMFPGPGSRSAGMGPELYKAVPLFKEEMDRCFTLLEPLLEDEADNIKEIIWSDRSNRSYESYKSYAFFCFEYALGQLLLKAGIKPAVMIGDSPGEYSAACLSGVFSLEDALNLLKIRGQSPRESGLEERVGRLTLNKPAIPFISGVTGKRITPEDAVNPRYWATHLRQTRQVVPFADGLKELKQIENAVFVETGDVGDVERLLSMMGRLWLSGISIDWSALYTGEKRKRVPLPGYPFDKQYYSIEPPLQNMGLMTPAASPTP